MIYRLQVSVWVLKNNRNGFGAMEVRRSERERERDVLLNSGVFFNIDAFPFSRTYINVPNSFLQGDHVSNTILCIIHGFSMGWWCHEVCTIRSSCDELEKSTSHQSADRKMHGKSRRLVDALSSRSKKDQVESTKKYPTLINCVHIKTASYQSRY